MPLPELKKLEKIKESRAEYLYNKGLLPEQREILGDLLDIRQVLTERHIGTQPEPSESEVKLWHANNPELPSKQNIDT